MVLQLIRLHDADRDVMRYIHLHVSHAGLYNEAGRAEPLRNLDLCVEHRVAHQVNDDTDCRHCYDSTSQHSQ